MKNKIIKFLFICLLFGKITSAQDYKNFGWTELAAKKGISISFIFYKKANNIKNGIVLKIKNDNEYDVVYNFTLIFKAGKELKEEFISGEINSRQIKAGSSDGLFFLPFDKTKTISELGIKKLKVAKKKL